MQGAGKVDSEEHAGDTVAAPAPVAWAFPLNGRVNDRIHPPDQFPCGCVFPQRARQPLNRASMGLEGAAVTACSVPAAKVMTRIGEMANKVTAEEAGCPRNGYAHTEFSMEDRSDAPVGFLTAGPVSGFSTAVSTGRGSGAASPGKPSRQAQQRAHGQGRGFGAPAHRSGHRHFLSLQPIERSRPQARASAAPSSRKHNTDEPTSPGRSVSFAPNFRRAFREEFSFRSGDDDLVGNGRR